jgi:hypothetical protein
LFGNFWARNKVDRFTFSPGGDFHFRPQALMGVFEKEMGFGIFFRFRFLGSVRELFRGRHVEIRAVVSPFGVVAMVVSMVLVVGAPTGC